ncbi:MAG: zinc chelation protein SecC [Nitrosomonadales bacterium]|nr:zinc chelation protein SecC [Nitrosomonadales bacterium]
MNDRSEKLPNELLDVNESCCSDSSCCPPKTPIMRDTPKVGRNDPCICGNGRKFKKCCGKNI